MTDLRILIVDDHPVFRYGLRALMTAEDGMDVVGEATTGREAVALAGQLSPNVIVMDLNLPDMNGIEATRQILATDPRIGILVITMFDDEAVVAALRAGARGYLLKGAQGDETVHAIRAVGHGQAVFSPTIAERLIPEFGISRPSPAPVFPELSEREHDVLHLIAQGLTNQAIADRLSLAPKTVRNHVSHIFSKLQVAGRAEAVVRAREAGLGERRPFHDARVSGLGDPVRPHTDERGPE